MQDLIPSGGGIPTVIPFEEEECGNNGKKMKLDRANGTGRCQNPEVQKPANEPANDSNNIGNGCDKKE